jgi:hypothetical protein
MKRTGLLMVGICAFLGLLLAVGTTSCTGGKYNWKLASVLPDSHPCTP